MFGGRPERGSGVGFECQRSCQARMLRLVWGVRTVSHRMRRVLNIMFSGTSTNTRPYDPRTHITARQLRSLGFLLQEHIPDDAFVRRAAVDLDPVEALDDGTSRLGLL